MKKKYEYKTYGESKMEIPLGWYTVSEIEELLKNAKACDKTRRKMLKKSMELTGDMKGE